MGRTAQDPAQELARFMVENALLRAVLRKLIPRAQMAATYIRFDPHVLGAEAVVDAIARDVDAARKLVGE
jgi:hypothetical protein